MNSGDRIRPPDRPLIPGEAYIDYGPSLPGGYGILTVRALVRDPRCVFAYWEWPSPPAGPPWVIRLRDVDAGSVALHALDTTSVVAGTLHFDAAPDRTYEVDLGWTEGSDFTVVKTSNRVRTPRDRPTSEIDPEWTPGPGEAEMLRGSTGEIFQRGAPYLRRWGPSHV